MVTTVGGDVLKLASESTLLDAIDLSLYVTEDVGLPTLRDIISELKKPGRDPRESFISTSFREDVMEIKDLKEGMSLNGVVTNVAAFGAFVDLGVHQDGLVHISQLADRFVKDPNTIVKVGQQVQVRVLEVDLQRKRIGLTMRSDVAEMKNDKVQKAKPTPKPETNKGYNTKSDLASALEKSGFKIKKRK